MKTTISDMIKHNLETAKVEEDKAFITALGRGILLLSAFEEQQQLTHQQLCEITGLPKATISRLLHTLLTLKFITRTGNDSYKLGKNLLRLSASAWQNQDMIDEALPLLKEFAIKHQVSVNIATESEGEMRYLACYRSPARLAVNLAVGSTVPIAQTAIGRAYYSALTGPMQQQIIQDLPYSTNPDQLQEEKSKAVEKLTQASKFYQQHNFCLSDGEFSPDILAVAVPLYDPLKGEYTHSLNASVPRAVWNADEYVEYIVPHLQALARQIEEL